MEFNTQLRSATFWILSISGDHYCTITFLCYKRRISNAIMGYSVGRSFCGMAEKKYYKLVFNRKCLQFPDNRPDLDRSINRFRQIK